VCEISLEPLNEFAPNSQGRHVWFLARMSLNVKVRGQGHHGQKRHFRPFRRPACRSCLVKHRQSLVVSPLRGQKSLFDRTCNFNIVLVPPSGAETKLNALPHSNDFVAKLQTLPSKSVTDKQKHRSFRPSHRRCAKANPSILGMMIEGVRTIFARPKRFGSDL